MAQEQTSDVELLRAELDQHGYDSSCLERLLDIDSVWQFLRDPVKDAVLYCRRSTARADTPVGVLARLFAFNSDVEGDVVESLLSASLIDLLTQLDLLRRNGSHYRARSALLPVDGVYVVADRLFEQVASTRRVTFPVCDVMPPHESTWLTLQECPEWSEGTLVLDLGCGSGVIGMLAAQGGASVIAVDSSSRCLSRTRFNAALNGLATKIAVGRTPPRGVQDARAAVVVFNSSTGPSRCDGGWRHGATVASAVRDACRVAADLAGTAEVRIVVLGLLTVRGGLDDALRELKRETERAGTRDAIVSLVESSGLTLTRQARDGDRLPFGSLLFSGPSEFNELREFMMSESLDELRPVSVKATIRR